MKYIIRALKYWIYLSLILCIIIFALISLKLVDGNIEQLFVNGYDSIWQIALITAAFAAVYPRLGYGTQRACIAGSPEELRPVLDRIMADRGYVLEKEDDGTLCFRKRAVAAKIAKFYEDRISVTPVLGGYELEGLRKDVIRLVTALESVNEEN